jgi:hypothetical protein
LYPSQGESYEQWTSWETMSNYLVASLDSSSHNKIYKNKSLSSLQFKRISFIQKTKFKTGEHKPKMLRESAET